MTELKQPAVLTLVLTSPSQEDDPLDASGENKRLMMAVADRILDAAILRLPTYLSHLPAGSLPTADQISKALRRDYRINGPEVEVDVSVKSKNLPEEWLAALDRVSEAQKSRPIPSFVVLVSKVTGWVLGVEKKDQEDVLNKVHKEVHDRQRANVAQQVSSGLADLVGVALELEVVAQAPEIVSTTPLRQISLRRKM